TYRRNTTIAALRKATPRKVKKRATRTLRCATTSDRHARSTVVSRRQVATRSVQLVRRELNERFAPLHGGRPRSASSRHVSDRGTARSRACAPNRKAPHRRGPPPGCGDERIARQRA